MVTNRGYHRVSNPKIHYEITLLEHYHNTTFVVVEDMVNDVDVGGGERLLMDMGWPSISTCCYYVSEQYSLRDVLY